MIEEPRIMEISFGEWEGLCCASGRSEIPGTNFLETFHKTPFNYVPAPGGESIADVCARTADFYQELSGNPEYQDKTILISTHGCASRAFLRNVYEDKEDYWHGGVPMNCAVSIVDVRMARLCCWNQIRFIMMLLTVWIIMPLKRRKMKTSDFYYELPEELIAQDPLEDRSSSRLLCLNRETGDIRHGHFGISFRNCCPETVLWLMTRR